MATFKLKHPIQAHGETVEDITLPARVQVKHMRAMDEGKGDIGKLAALLGALAGLPPSAVDQIDSEDFTVIGAALGELLGESAPTGGR